jgi:ligand-binding sensor domain-containing protein
MTHRFLLLLIIFFPRISTGQKHFVRRVNINSDQTEVIPYVMAQDEKGFMYLGTNKGLFRFDGISFKYIEGFNKKITALCYQNNKLYIGCNDGTFAQMINHKITLFPSKATKIRTEISSINCSKEDNKISISTKGQGIVIINNQTQLFIDQKKYLSDNFVYGVVQNQKTFWAATDKGVNKLSQYGGLYKINQFKTSDGLHDNIVSSISLSPNNTKICMGFQQAGISLYDTSITKLQGFIQNAEWGQINNIFFEDNEHLWAGTSNGQVLQIEVGQNNIVLKDTIQLGSSVNNLAKDIAGNIWVITESGLFEIVAPNIFSIRLPKENFRLSEISAIANQFDTLVFFAMQNTMYCFNTKTKTVKDVLKAKDIITKIFRQQDDLWIGTLNNGVWKFNIKQRVSEKINLEGIANDAHILDINSDENNLWIASLEGLFQCKKNPENREQYTEIRKHNKHDGLGSDYVYQIFIDHKKRVWFATDGAGPSLYENGVLKTLAGKIPELKSKVVYSIDESTDGKIWFTTLGNGILSYDDNKWQQYERNYGLEKGELLAIATQPNWHVIALQPEAIFEYFPKQNFFRKYNKQSGIDLDSLSQNINLISKNEEGDLIIPNQNGFIYFRSKTEQNTQTSQIRIINIQVFLKDVPLGNHQFDNSENQISFGFENTNFTNTEKLYYRYRLRGLSDQWIATNDKKITYSKLSAGTYLFEIQVSHNINFNSVQSDAYEIIIAKAFWQRWWFYLILLSIVAYIIWYYVRFREAGVRKFESIQKERLNFEYEQLKSQVNPHFLFNSLNTLVDLIDENAPRATDYTIHLAAMYRTLLSFRDKELISIKEEIGLLEHYTFVQKCRFGEALQIEIDIDDYVAQKYKIVPLALQLLVENAIKHNEVSKANPLKISIALSGYQIIITNQLRPKISEEKGEGFGISNLQTRYRLLAKKEIELERENNYFVVKLPLL